MKTSLDATMFRLFDQLPRTEDEFEKHLSALEVMTGDAGNEALINHLYGTLSILDSKSSSMLAFNGIMVAAYVIYLAATKTSNLQFVLANFGTISVLVSSALLLSVVWVHWSTTEDLLNGRIHYLDLVKVRMSRTVRYRIAWYFSFLGVFSLAATLMVGIWTR